ncbi:hypothetical protein [Yoonia sp. MH D7]
MKLNHAAKIFLVVGLSVGAQKATADNQSSVSALPDANVAAVSDSGYVDPEISNRNRCLNHPGRPAWMMVQPLGFEWRLDLANKFRSSQRAMMVTGAQTCNCDMLYPDWDAFRADLEEIWNGVSRDSQYVWNAGTRSQFETARNNLAEYSSPLVTEVSRLCKNVE